jgi:hypothetical protein
MNVQDKPSFRNGSKNNIGYAYEFNSHIENTVWR